MFVRLLLYFALVLDRSSAVKDICHGDPAITRQFNESCKDSLLISIPDLHGNPFHSLHDVLWAVSHYMFTCIEDNNKTHVWVKEDRPINLTLCDHHPSPNTNTSQFTHWGACVLSALAESRKLPKENIHFRQKIPEFCFKEITTLPAKFRELKYCTRRQNQTWFSKRSNSEKLPDEYTHEALHRLVSAVLSKFSIPTNVTVREKLKVLVYDRKLVRKRRWNNVNDTLRLLYSNTELDTQYLDEMPHLPSKQFLLFRKADIILTPHGAALANSIFSRPGTEIIEVNKCCRDEVRNSPFEKRKWTSWHSDAMQIGLRYIQCHEGGQIRSQVLLSSRAHRTAEDRWCDLKYFDVEPSDAYNAVLDAAKRIFLRRNNHKSHYTEASKLVPQTARRDLRYEAFSTYMMTSRYTAAGFVSALILLKLYKIVTG